MSVTYPVDDISFAPLKKDIRAYSFETFRQDLIAGLSVAMLAVPQALAYAMVAGLPLSCGLVSAIFASLISAIFGSSRQLVVGPGNAIAILIQYGISEILFNHYRDLVGPARDEMAWQIAIQLCFMVGFIQIVAAACKLGRLTQFISHSVIVGYVVGTVLALIISQLFVFLGIVVPEGLYSLYDRILYLVTHLNQVHVFSVAIGLISFTMLFTLKRMKINIPATLLMLIAVSALVHFSGLSTYQESGWLDNFSFFSHDKVNLVGDIGEISPAWVYFEMPFINTTVINNLLPVAVAIALLSMLETTMVAKSIAANTGQVLSVNQEIFGLGLANFFSSLMGAMPCSGSPSRSTLLYSLGGKTRFASVINALGVALIVLFLSPYIVRIPLAALSVVLLINVVRIVNKKHFLLCFKATRSDAFVLFGTLASCLFFSLDVAFYIGMGLSVTLYIKKASVPQLVECTLDSEGHLGTLNDHDKHSYKKIRLINVYGELFFGAADLFQNALKSLTEDDMHTRVIILRLKNARDIDATTCLALQQLNDFLKSSGRLLIACSLTQQSWEVLCDSGLVEQMGKENLFILDEKRSHLSEQRALMRANEWMAESPVKVVNEAVADVKAGEDVEVKA